MTNSLDLPHPPSRTRIVVAMSGGLDSSVVASLLTKQGYDVVGITLQLYDSGGAPRRAGSCCAGQDIHDARRVAEMLEIPHYVLDYEERFRHAVIEPFADSYLAGETPVPCVSCNQTVKFRDLLDVARDLGAEALATGHYIDSRQSGPHRSLHRPVDLARDQSYFLYATTQEQIDFLRFPLGRLTKPEAREMAREAGLAIAEKPDSQDICFVSNGRYSDLLARLRPESARAGDIVDLDGRRLGRHAGVANFTVGQRRGIGIAVGEPLYVVALDAPRGRVVVGPRDALATRRLSLRSVNWLGDDGLPSAAGADLFVRVRSTRPPTHARVAQSQTGQWIVELAAGEDGVAPGQACVFYDGEAAGARVLGGGVIAATDAASLTRELNRPAGELESAAG